MITRKNILPILLVLATIGGCVYLWWFFKPTPPVGEHVPATVAPQIKKVEKIEITPAKIRVYAPKAKAKLKLPDAMQANEQVHVIESTLVKADDHPHTITTVIDAKTGETTTLDRREPLPWLAFKKSGALGLSRDLLTTVNTLYVRQDFLQVKSLCLSGSLSLDSVRQTGAKVAVEWRW